MPPSRTTSVGKPLSCRAGMPNPIVPESEWEDHLARTQDPVHRTDPETALQDGGHEVRQREDARAESTRRNASAVFPRPGRRSGTR